MARMWIKIEDDFEGIQKFKENRKKLGYKNNTEPMREKYREIKNHE